MFKYDSLPVPDKLSELERIDENILNYSKYGIEGTTLLAFRDTAFKSALVDRDLLLFPKSLEQLPTSQSFVK